MSIATDLQTVYDNLQAALTDCNAALTEKGGAGAEALNGVAAAITALPSGSSELPTLTNPAADSDVVSGKEYIDQNGAKRTGTMAVSLPAGITECEVQTFTPEADTNEALTFSLNMTEMPTHIYIATDMPNVVSRSFVEYYCSKPVESELGDGVCMGGNINYYTPSVLNSSVATPDSSTARSGVWGLTNKGFTFRSYYYGGQFTYFRAGYTYTIIAMRIVPL